MLEELGRGRRSFGGLSEENWEVGGVFGSSDEFLGGSKEFWEGVGGDFGGGVGGVWGGRRSFGRSKECWGGRKSFGGGSKEFWGCRRSFKGRPQEWPQELTARE